MATLSLAALALLALAPPAAGAATNKGVVGFFGASGANAGQISTPRGVAVNQSSGDVYAVDGANNRAVEFNSNGEFLRAFGADVIAEGPDQANETQTVSVAATSGNFTLSFNGATTTAIAATASAATVQAELNALATIGGLTPVGAVTVSGGPGDATASTPYKITFGGSLAHTDVAQIAAANLSLAGGSPASSVTAATSNPGATGFEICVPAAGDACKAGIASPPIGNGGQLNSPQGIAVNQASGDVYVSEQGNLRVSQFDSEGHFIAAFGQAVVATGPDNSTPTSAVQTLTVTATGGKYTLSFGGKTSGELPVASSAATIQSALTGLASIGAANATVSETGPGLFQITFAGALANNPEPTIAAASGIGAGNELSGGSATVANTTTGSGEFEACLAATGDVCKLGASTSTGGAFKASFVGHPAIAPTGAANAGDVLLADPANLRVQEFSPAGAFIRAFGFNVVSAGPDNNGTTNFEVCSAAAGDACRTGATGPGAGQFSNSVNRLAEDAAGNLYTVEPATNFRLQKFTMPAPTSTAVTPTGPYDAAELTGTASTPPTDVAIDPATSDVLVTKVFPAGATASCPIGGAPSLEERRVLEVDPTLNGGLGAVAATDMTCEGINSANGLAVRSSTATGDIYVSSTTIESRLYVLNTLLSPPTVAFNGVSDISAHAATISGAVNPHGPAALPYGVHTTYRFEYKRAADPSFTSTADTDLGSGNSDIPVSRQLHGLEAGTEYEVRLRATKPFYGTALTSTASFITPAAPAEVSTPTATTTATATGATAALYGVITPNSQPTSYRFEYLSQAEFEENGNSFSGPNPPISAPLPDGSLGGAVPVPVAQTLSELQPATTYHFRLRAENGTPPAALSAERTFTTPPLGSALPDSRGVELVSPPDKRPDGTTQGFIVDVRQVDFQAAIDGNSFLFPILSGLGDTTAGGSVRYLAKRLASGWQSTQISAPSLVTPFGTSVSAIMPSQIAWASPDLSCQVIETFNPITADTPPADLELGVANLYLRDAAGHITLITDRVPANPQQAHPGEAYAVVGAPADCNRIFFKTEYKLAPGTPSGVYEWDNGTLRDAGILPNGAAAAGSGAGAAEIGGMTNPPSYLYSPGINAVSPAGRLFFSATSNQGGDAGEPAVFVRKGPGDVVDASQKQGGTKKNDGANYQTASPDGSHLFFTANYGLAAGPAPAAGWPPSCHNFVAADEPAKTGLNGEGCDLYDYDIAAGTLTDLSADTNPADPKGAAVNGVVAVSEDGSYVYFAAEGQLVPGEGKTYLEDISEKKVNIYLAHAGTLTYVATIKNSDPAVNSSGDLDRNVPGFPSNGTAGGDLMVQSATWTAQATPDGRHLLFTARSNVSGYPAGAAAQAYLYSAESGSTVCVSCRPDGQPSLGSFVTEPIRSANSEVEERYRTPSSISDDGSRVFFTMPDVLAPGAVAGKANLYEWDNGQVSLLNVSEYGSDGKLYGGFRDASPSGSDVFVQSFQQLSPYDFDTVEDIYDFRAGGGFPNPPPPPAHCNVASSECQGTPTPSLAASTPASQSFSGPANPSIQAPKCPKGKVRRHGKCVAKKPHHKKSHKRHANRTANTSRGGAK